MKHLAFYLTLLLDGIRLLEKCSKNNSQDVVEVVMLTTEMHAKCMQMLRDA